jgi:hypothetical protein
MPPCSLFPLQRYLKMICLMPHKILLGMLASDKQLTNINDGMLLEGIIPPTIDILVINSSLNFVKNPCLVLVSIALCL